MKWDVFRAILKQSKKLKSQVARYWNMLDSLKTCSITPNHPDTLAHTHTQNRPKCLLASSPASPWRSVFLSTGILSIKVCQALSGSSRLQQQWKRMEIYWFNFVTLPQLTKCPKNFLTIEQSGSWPLQVPGAIEIAAWNVRFPRRLIIPFSESTHSTSI